MLGHASIQQTQRYLNLTDKELRKGLEVSWGRQASDVLLQLANSYRLRANQRSKFRQFLRVEI
jgi:hypothetical protein